MQYRIILFALLALLWAVPGCMTRTICELPGPTPQSTAGPKIEGRLRNLGNGICLDQHTGKSWQLAKSPRITALAGANRYLRGLGLGGHDDWRLPTLAELYELFLLLDSQGPGDCPMDFTGNYWSGDVDTQGRVGAWELDGDCHPEREYVPKEAGYVRAVRP